MNYSIITLISIFFTTYTTAFSQSSSNCTTNGPMFISVEQPATFKGSLLRFFENEFKTLRQDSEGAVQLQILIDTNGSACCMNVTNNSSGISIQKIKDVVSNMPTWKPARQNNFLVIFSALIRITFDKTSFEVVYINENPPIQNATVNPNTTNNPEVINDQKNNTIWKLWNYSNSMIPTNLSRSVAMEPNGTIWYCTDKGLVRITNDEKWEVFSGMNIQALAGKNKKTWTTELAIDKAGNVWVLSFDEVVKFDGRQWVTFDERNSPLKLVRKICPDKNGIVWFCTFKGLIKYDGKNWTKYNTSNSKLASDNVKDVFVGKDETIWIATEKGINKVQNDDWSLLNQNNSKIPVDDVNSIEGDNTGNIWAGLGNDKKTHLIRIDQTNNISVFPSGVIWNITVDNTNNKIWLATNGQGLVSFDGKEFTQYDKSNSIIPNNTVSDILIDLNGNKWISTFGGLVFTNKK